MDILDVGLFVGFGLLILTAAAAIILPLVNSLKTPSTLIRAGMGVAVLLVLFLISYGLAGSEINARYIAAGVGESASKLVGAGLTLFYILLVASFIGIIFSEINKALK